MYPPGKPAGLSPADLPPLANPAAYLTPYPHSIWGYLTLTFWASVWFSLPMVLSCDHSRLVSARLGWIKTVWPAQPVEG